MGFIFEIVFIVTNQGMPDTRVLGFENLKKYVDQSIFFKVGVNWSFEKSSNEYILVLKSEEKAKFILPRKAIIF